MGRSLTLPLCTVFLIPLVSAGCLSEQKADHPVATSKITVSSLFDDAKAGDRRAIRQLEDLLTTSKLSIDESQALLLLALEKQVDHSTDARVTRGWTALLESADVRNLLSPDMQARYYDQIITPGAFRCDSEIRTNEALRVSVEFEKTAPDRGLEVCNVGASASVMSLNLSLNVRGLNYQYKLGSGAGKGIYLVDVSLNPGNYEFNFESRFELFRNGKYVTTVKVADQKRIIVTGHGELG